MSRESSNFNNNNSSYPYERNSSDLRYSNGLTSSNYYNKNNSNNKNNPYLL